MSPWSSGATFAPRHGRKVFLIERRKVGMTAKYKKGFAAELTDDMNTFTFWKKEWKSDTCDERSSNNERWMYLIDVISKCLCQRFGKILPLILCNWIMNKKDMNKSIVYIWYFLVNHAKSQRISFVKQKYLIEITGTLINLKINNIFHHKMLLAK